MKKRSFYKDISRTLRNNISRFIAIVVMVALGSGVFTGFTVGCLNVFQSANDFYRSQNMYDIKIVSTLGLTNADLSAVSKVEGVSAVFGNRSIDVKVEQSKVNSLLANVTTLDKGGINKPYVLEGSLPSKAGQIAVNSKFIDDSGLQIGDYVTLTEADSTKEAAAANTTTAEGVKEKTNVDNTFDSASDKPTLAVSQYEITAVILSPLDIKNKEASIASISFSTSSSDYLMYVTNDSIQGDLYSAIYLTIDGASKLDSYSSYYKMLVNNMTKAIEETIQKQREQSRYDEVRHDANNKIADANKLLTNKMADAEQKLADAQIEIDDGLVKVKDGWLEVKANEANIKDGEHKLAAAQISAEEKFTASQKKIDNGRKDLKAAVEKLNSQEKTVLEQFAGYERQFTQNQAVLVKQKSEADVQLSSTVAGLSADARRLWNDESARQIWADMKKDGENAAPYLIVVNQGEHPTSDQTNIYTAAMTALQKDKQILKEYFNSVGAPLNVEQMDTFSTLAVKYGTLNYSQTQLNEKSTEMNKQKSKALVQITQARNEIEDNKTKLTLGQKKLDENKAAAKMQFAEKKKKLADGEQKLEDAKKKLMESEDKLTKAQTKLNEKKSDYENTITTEKQKLEDAKEKVAKIRKAKWYILERSNNDSFTGLYNDISFIQEITKAFPLIFFLVAILISLTAMTRMVEEDRGLIGIYKSLGYSKLQISLKYILYSALACVSGGILGTVIGFYILPKIIEIIVNELYVLPTFQLSFYLNYGLVGFVLFLVGVVGATVISCAELVHMRPAELMRPKAPKAGNRILMERIPFIWKRLTFLNKVTCRNLFRYKKRAFMTIVGILGCTMLIVFGLGIRDTVGNLMSDQFDNITVYDDLVVTDSLSTEKMQKLANELHQTEGVKSEMQLKTTTLTLHGKRDDLDITVMVIPDGVDMESFVHLQDSTTHKAMTLPLNGIVVTQNAAKQLKLIGGDIVSLQNEENLEHDFPVAYVTTNYAGNYVYISERCYQEAFGDYSANSLLLKMSDNSNKQILWDILKKDKRILTVSNSQEVRDAFSDVNQIINMVVYLLITMSAILAFAVLFTLSNINISERERELATVKVLGFFPKEVYSYVNKETVILTLFGILFGMPIGYGITYFILSNVNIANIAFKVHVSVMAYLTAVLLTLIFTLIVNRITNKALRRIHMVEALKSVE